MRDYTHFFIRLGNKNIEINCLYGQLIRECKDYVISSVKPDIVVNVSKEELERFKDEEYNAEIIPNRGVFGKNVAVMYLCHLEPLFVSRRITEAMLDYGIILMHGAAVAVDSSCYIFTAQSGVGKTTHIKNWLKRIPGSFVVNGDKPLVDGLNSIVYGTPWCGKEKMNTNTFVPLSGLIALERGKSNSIVKISFEEMLPHLLQQCYIPSQSEQKHKAYQIIGKFKSVPCYKLRCNMEEDSAIVAYNGIKQSEKMA